MRILTRARSRCFWCSIVSFPLVCCPFNSNTLLWKRFRLNVEERAEYFWQETATSAKDRFSLKFKKQIFLAFFVRNFGQFSLIALVQATFVTILPGALYCQSKWWRHKRYKNCGFSRPVPAGTAVYGLNRATKPVVSSGGIIWCATVVRIKILAVTTKIVFMRSAKVRWSTEFTTFYAANVN